MRQVVIQIIGPYSDPSFRSHQKQFLLSKDRFNTSITNNRDTYTHMINFLNLQKEVLEQEIDHHTSIKRLL